jgi:2-C-methyl-D-erythritol 2,4-cyclodiphosphate synthase
MLRTGIGYDSHQFTEGKPLILGGERIPHTHGLLGHSDADAVAHAVIDAILGAAAAGDIGSHFPPSEAKWKDADSIELLRTAVGIVAARGCRVNQADVTVILERPRLGPYIPAMRAKVAAALGLPTDAVSIKAKTNEGMGFIGRGEGIAVLAVATLEAP